jgi:hypothetical protein
LTTLLLWHLALTAVLICAFLVVVVLQAVSAWARWAVNRIRPTGLPSWQSRRSALGR